MPHRDAPAICRKIDAALSYMTEDEDLRPWLTWQIEEILQGPKHIGLDDCSPSELMSLLAILVPIFNRGLVGGELGTSLPVDDATILTLIRGGDGETGT
jgi:hypothetical protein